jgi:hypothetical protein
MSHGWGEECYVKTYLKGAGGYRCNVCELCFSAEDAKIHSTVICQVRRTNEHISPKDAHRRRQAASPSAKVKREITPAALYELFEANSQCVKNGEGKCPLLVFSVQFAEAINHFFSEKD